MAIKLVNQNIKIQSTATDSIKKPVINSQALRVQEPVVRAISALAQKAEVTHFKDYLDADKKRVQEIETQSGVTDADRKMHGNYVKSIYYPSLKKVYLVALKKIDSCGFPVIKQVLVEAHEIDRYIQTIKSTVDVGAILREQMQKMGFTIDVR